MKQTKLQSFLSSKLTQVSAMRVKAKTGDLFGLELECEGVRVGDEGGDIEGWEAHADGSLRDHHGQACEWVFAGPVTLDKAQKRVSRLFEYFDKKKSRLVCSNRTSTHVHFNMGDKSVYQLMNVFILFTLFEGVLDKYCGEDREGNLFCLSSRHAERQIKWVEDACSQHYSLVGFKENFRYCSLNLAAINKFGTVEFRAMRGLDKKEDVLDWLNILNEFTQYACHEMRNPVDLVQAVSVDTPAGFMRKVFSDESYGKLTRGLSPDYINRSVYEGLRLVQMLCHKIGSEFDQVELNVPDYWATLAGGEPKNVKAGVVEKAKVEWAELAERARIEGLVEEIERERQRPAPANPANRLNPFIVRENRGRPAAAPGFDIEAVQRLQRVGVADHQAAREAIQAARDDWFEREMDRMRVRAAVDGPVPPANPFDDAPYAPDAPEEPVL